jgi:hypothetical protein
MKKILDKETAAREASFWEALKKAVQGHSAKVCRK